jgi:hypothetical protein
MGGTWWFYRKLQEDIGQSELANIGRGLYQTTQDFTVQEWPFSRPTLRDVWIIHFTHTELVSEWCGVTSHEQVSHTLGKHPLTTFSLSGNGWQAFSLLRKNPSSQLTLLRCSSAISPFRYEGNIVFNIGQLLQFIFEFVCSKSHVNPHSVIMWSWDWYVIQSYATTGLDRSLRLP